MNIELKEEGKMGLTERLFPHGNRNSMKEEVRKDSETAQLDIIDLLIGMNATLGLRLGCLDFKGAYLQSNQACYLHPHRKEIGKSGTIWRLRNIPYEITETGRLWALVMGDWIAKKAGMYTVPGVPQMFMKQKGDGSIRLMIFKVKNECLLGGELETVTDFIRRIKKRFVIRK